VGKKRENSLRKKVNFHDQHNQKNRRNQEGRFKQERREREQTTPKHGGEERGRQGVEEGGKELRGSFTMGPVRGDVGEPTGSVRKSFETKKDLHTPRASGKISEHYIDSIFVVTVGGGGR